MNDELMFEYLLQMGGMRPQQMEMMRRQKQIEALRGNAMEPVQGQMVGKHYVAPSITQYMSQLGQGYMAGRGQQALDQQMGRMNAEQGNALRQLQERQRRKRMGLTNITGEMDTADYGGSM